MRLFPIILPVLVAVSAAGNDPMDPVNGELHRGQSRKLWWKANVGNGGDARMGDTFSGTKGKAVRGRDGKNGQVILCHGNKCKSREVGGNEAEEDKRVGEYEEWSGDGYYTWSNGRGYMDNEDERRGNPNSRVDPSKPQEYNEMGHRYDDVDELMNVDVSASRETRAKALRLTLIAGLVPYLV